MSRALARRLAADIERLLATARRLCAAGKLTEHRYRWLEQQFTAWLHRQQRQSSA